MRSHSQSMQAAGYVSGKSWNQPRQQHHGQTQQVTMGFWPQSKDVGFTLEQAMTFTDAFSPIPPPSKAGITHPRQSLCL